MELTISGQASDFFQLETKNNITDSSGIEKPAKLVYAFYGVVKSMIIQPEERFKKTDTYVDGSEISYSISYDYELKEKEWMELVGKKKFQSLDKELRDFLINAAGMFDLGFPVDIKKAYKYSIYDNED
jgi:hypothetical protein